MADLISTLEQDIRTLKLKSVIKNVGQISWIGDGVATIEGLSECMYSEVLNFPGGVKGLALNLEEDSVGAVIFGDYTQIKSGMEVTTSGQILQIPVSDQLLGRVIDPLGNPLDGKGKITAKTHYPIEKVASGVITRQSVTTPLQTGIKTIDALIPIGRGQRELIIGDRNTGKTTIAIDTIVNQTDVVCIYVAIGQKTSKIAQIVAKLTESGAMKHTVVVAASAADSATLQYIAPYAGAAIGEYFMDQGRDALVVYDDLSKHAASYRQMALLLRRPSGREAYPGDVFYLHSRLLERAARVNSDHGGGSLTALPIIETQAGDVSAYIPTNVISITDGQIFLESDLFYSGIRPAVNIGISVSRVGGSAQIKAMKSVAGKLKLDLAQYRALAAFAQFSQDLDPVTKEQIERGRRITEILKQPPFSPVPVENQIAILWAANAGYLDQVPVEQIRHYEDAYLKYLQLKNKQLLPAILKEKNLTDQTVQQLEKLTKEFNQMFLKNQK